MVNSWLKVRLIKDFFDLLSEDRSADSRRLNYWLGFLEPAIQDMWFVLGADAMGDKREDYTYFANGRIAAFWIWRAPRQRQIMRSLCTSATMSLLSSGSQETHASPIATTTCHFASGDASTAKPSNPLLTSPT